MATVQRTLHLAARPDDVWDALRDWPAVHERLVQGFVIEARMDGEDRVLTFFNGVVARERLIACDETNRRLVWSAVDTPYTHHNASAQVFAEDNRGGTRFVWTADFLPGEYADQMAAMMDRGIQAVRDTLDG